MILVVLPWSAFWDHNLFVVTLPLLERVLASPYARGAVSGVGVITAVAGVFELATAFGARRAPAQEGPHAGV